MDPLELLQKGDVDAFNAARTQRTRPELFAAELPGARLVGVDLSQANLEKADLTGAVLTDATLVRADLSGSDGTGVDISGALGLKIRLRGAWWDNANLDEADLTRGDLTEVVLQGSSGSGVRLLGAKIRHADLSEVTFPDADLSEARLHHAKLIKADLSRADLTEAVATECDLTDAILDGATGTRANFNESTLVRARFSGARLQEASFSQCDLTEADFSGSDLTRANLSGATLTGTDLSGTCLADANLEGCDLSQAKLGNADLTGHDPRALGLTDEAIEKLSAWGAQTVADAPLIVAEPAAARNGKKVALLWLNPDSETLSTLRWALLGGKTATHGTLPMSADGVMAKAVVPTEDGFELLMIMDRPGGAALVRVPLGPDGKLGVTATTPLMYPPAVVPIATRRDGRLWLYGLAKKGATALVVQRLGEEGLELVHSERVNTAKGFWSTHHPVVATRGGVVIDVDASGTGRPMRTPAGFPGKAARVVPHAGGPVAVWFEPPVNEDVPGFLKWAVLGGRGEPEVRTLKQADRVTSLDAISGPDGVHVAWVERHNLLSTLVFRAKLPKGELGFVEAAGDAGHEVRFAAGPAGQAPALVVSTLDEAVVAVDGNKKLGELGGEKEE